MLVMEKGKIVKSVGIELPDGKIIKSLQEGESYKYLGILEADKFLEEKIKLNVSKEYIRKIRNVFKSKLNGGNLVRRVNTWAVSLLRYSAAFISWRKSEVQAVNRTTRKLCTINESSNINEVIRPVLNFLYFFTIRFHKYKKAQKAL